MKKLLCVLLVMALALFAVSCNKNDDEVPEDPNNGIVTDGDNTEDADEVVYWTAEEGLFEGVPQYTGAGEIQDFSITEDVMASVFIYDVPQEDYEAYIDLLTSEGFTESSDEDGVLVLRGEGILLAVTYDVEDGSLHLLCTASVA